jgi:hypothetical protein
LWPSAALQKAAAAVRRQFHHKGRRPICVHPQKPLQWWCCTHAMPFCVHCTVLDHPKGQCDCKFLKTIADEARKELVNGPVEAKAVALKGVVVQNKAKSGELKALGETKKREFRAAVTVIKNAADARVRTFEAEVDVAVARGCAGLRGAARRFLCS